jgi:hypothetical protein
MNSSKDKRLEVFVIKESRVEEPRRKVTMRRDLEEEHLQREIEFLLSKFETLKKRKAKIDEQYFIADREMVLSHEELMEMSENHKGAMTSNLRMLNQKDKEKENVCNPL